MIQPIERRYRPTFGRLREPSTYVGFAACLELVKVLAPQYSVVIAGVQAAAGGIAVAMRESGNKHSDEPRNGVAQYLDGGP